MAVQIMPAHIQLEDKAKKRALLGIYLLWAHRVLYSFTTPVVLPVVMEGYDMMGWYAIQSGLAALLGCITAPIGGKLGDIFGRRKICVPLTGALLALTVLCALKLSGPVFFVAYIMISFLNGVMSAYPISIISDLSTTAERPRLVGLYATINGVGMIVAMLLGGMIADNLDPFLGFVLFTPVGVLGLIFLAIYYPNKPADHKVSVDRQGMILMSCGVSAILIWCFFGGVLFPRGSALGIALLVVGVILIVILLRVEKRIKEPLIDLNMFRRKPFAQSALACFLIAPMPTLCSSILILFGSMSLGLSNTVTGTLALPKNILFALLPAVLGTWLGRDFRRFRTIFLLCGMTTAVGSFIAAAWNVSTPILAIYLTMLLFGVSTSCQATAIQLYVQVSLPQEELGVAAAMVSFAGSIGGAIFNAAYNIVYNSKYAAAMELGGGEHLAHAISDVFSSMSVLTGVCGALIVIVTLLLIPKGRGGRAEEK